MEMIERVSLVLTGLGYTPKTLSESTGLSAYNAKKIFSGKGTLRVGEFFDICVLIGVSPRQFINDRTFQEKAPKTLKTT